MLKSKVQPVISEVAFLLEFFIKVPSLLVVCCQKKIGIFFAVLYTCTNYLDVYKLQGEQWQKKKRMSILINICRQGRRSLALLLRSLSDGAITNVESD